MHHFIHFFWKEIGVPIWPNLLASLIVWVFLKFQTVAIRKEHELTREHSQKRHEELLSAVASSPTTVVNNPEEVIINKEG